MTVKVFLTPSRIVNLRFLFLAFGAFIIIIIVYYTHHVLHKIYIQEQKFKLEFVTHYNLIF